MGTRLIFIPSDISKDVEELQFDSTPSDFGAFSRELTEKTALCYIERVHTGTITALGNGYEHISMIIDEDGHQKRLPVNARACLFYGGMIVGPAVLIGEEYGPEGPDFCSLPDTVTVEKVDSVFSNYKISGSSSK